MGFESVNWHDVFIPDTPLVEIFVRGTIVYLAIFFLLRFVLTRQSGNVGVTDLLVIVLIADAAQNAMASEYKSIPDGLLLVATIVFWSYALDWLAYHFPTFARLIHPPALELIRDGKVNRRNLRRELITMDELKAQLREQGIEKLDRVRSLLWRATGELVWSATRESSIRNQAAQALSFCLCESESARRTDWHSTKDSPTAGQTCIKR
jgi:uncharacterized membrane protein YcaP (DUF421 family)